MKLVWREPAPALRPLVRAFVEREDVETAGSSVELPLPMPLLHVMLGADYCLDSRVGMAPIPRASLWGSSTHVRRARPLGPIHAFVAILTFRGAASLARGRPLLADEVCSLPADGFAAEMAAAQSFDRRIELAEALISRAGAAESHAWMDRDVLAAAQAIAEDRLCGAVSAVADRFGLSERTLRNRFHREIGCSPKRFLRVARLNRVVRALHPRPWGTRPCYDPFVEFFDQSHFHREFQALAGISPTGFVRGKRRRGDRLVHSFVLDGAATEGG